MRIITVNIKTEVIKQIKDFVGTHTLYNCRTDFIRHAIRDLILEEIVKHKIEPSEVSLIPDPILEVPLNPLLITLSDGTTYKLKEAPK